MSFYALKSLLLAILLGTFLASTSVFAMKNMEFESQAQYVIQQRAELLQQWENITSEELTRQSQFTQDNEKIVVIPLKIVLAILDRPKRIFHKDGHKFMLIAEHFDGSIPSACYNLLCVPTEEGWWTEYGNYILPSVPTPDKWRLSFQIIKINEDLPNEAKKDIHTTSLGTFW